MLLAARPDIRRTAAMTIGVGFRCPEGVVLCSDRQITSSGGHKYEERKIFRASTPDYQLMFSYAGFPDAARMMFRKVLDNLSEHLPQEKGRFAHDKCRSILERVFEDKQSGNLQTLIAFKYQHHPVYLFKTWETAITDGLFEYIGSGDGSAIRYLYDMLLTDGMMKIDEAEVIASYIVSVASRYVDGCGGGPDRATLHDDGIEGEGTGGVYPNQRERFLHCEQVIGKKLRELLLAGGRE
jgi:20S proteasome alpha/beta subunit